VPELQEREAEIDAVIRLPARGKVVDVGLVLAEILGGLEIPAVFIGMFGVADVAATAQSESRQQKGDRNTALPHVAYGNPFVSGKRLFASVLRAEMCFFR